jgi:hypothetical protein
MLQAAGVLQPPWSANVTGDLGWVDPLGSHLHGNQIDPANAAGRKPCAKPR